MERRDVVLLAVLGLVALLLLLGAGAAALWWVRRRRKREADEEAAAKEPVKQQRNNGFLSLKTPLISTKTLGPSCLCENEEPVQRKQQQRSGASRSKTWLGAEGPSFFSPLLPFPFTVLCLILKPPADAAASDAATSDDAAAALWKGQPPPPC
ncbi:hypothetical protein FOCC_FOCC012930 [Frankliniella occidentalis]|nr:hypothetical protein FOCC_FOCC012930 [Frankliniella occidentalis]